MPFSAAAAGKKRAGAGKLNKFEVQGVRDDSNAWMNKRLIKGFSSRNLFEGKIDTL